MLGARDSILSPARDRLWVVETCCPLIRQQGPLQNHSSQWASGPVAGVGEGAQVAGPAFPQALSVDCPVIPRLHRPGVADSA